MTSPIDHLVLGISRLATQYREADNLIDYLEIFLRQSNEIETAINDTIVERFIDTATGTQLDIIGAIVGQSREASDAETAVFFGFEGDFGSVGFGDINDPSVGGRFIGVGEPPITTRLLTDEEYRVFIKARIIKNHSSGTIEDVVAQLNLIFPDVKVLVVEGNASYEVSIGKELSTNEKLIFLDSDILIKPVGVQVSYVAEFTNDAFSFAGVPDGAGFGDVNDPLVGGTFSKVIALG